MEKTGVEARLAARGISLSKDDQNDRPFAISGNTYAYRQFIKQANASWSKSEQAWRLPDEASIEALTDLIEKQPGLAEDATGFDNRQKPVNRVGDHKRHYHGHRNRLHERFQEQGADALADYELLELILFFSTDIRDTKPIAKDMIERFGGLGAVLAADPLRYKESIAASNNGNQFDEGRHSEDFRYTRSLLKAIRALHERVLREEIKMRPVISSWTALIDYLNIAMTHDPTEHFRILFLDRKNILIKDEVQSRGTVDHTPLYPREVVKRALELAASAIIMVHNHPSGDPTPSRADIDMTHQVIEALRGVNITVHDHVIVGKNQHTSFKSQKLI